MGFTRCYKTAVFGHLFSYDWLGPTVITQVSLADPGSEFDRAHSERGAWTYNGGGAGAEPQPGPGTKPLIRGSINHLKLNAFLQYHNLMSSRAICPKIFLQNKKISDVWGMAPTGLLGPATAKFTVRHLACDGRNKSICRLLHTGTVSKWGNIKPCSSPADSPGTLVYCEASCVHVFIKEYSKQWC